jgi:hypothetical protein
MSGPELDDATAWRWWCEQSAVQGLEPEIRDPAVIAKIVTLAITASDHQAEEGGGGRARAS